MHILKRKPGNRDFRLSTVLTCSDLEYRKASCRSGTQSVTVLRFRSSARLSSQAALFCVSPDPDIF